MTRLHRRALACLVTTLLFAGQAAPAFAQAPAVDDETRATARVVAQEGLDFYDKGLYKEALEKLDRANALVSAPTLGLMIGRCLEKLGRLVEASERYLDVSRTKIDAKSPDLFKKAVTDAATERDQLLPRIPSITVVVDGTGAGGTDTQVALDGKSIPTAMLGLKRLINPGTHRVEVTRGADRASQEFTLKEGEVREVKLVPAPQEDTGPKPPPSSGMPPQKLAGIVLMGVGAAGVITGAVTGGLAAGKLSDLEDGGCKDGHCLKSQKSDVGSYNTLRLVSTVGLYAGIGVAAGGVALFLTAPKAKAKPETGSIEPVLGAGYIGVRGTF